MSKKTSILYAYYLLISLGLLIYAQVNPRYNWDLICYLGAAKALVIADSQVLHQEVYSEVKRSVPPRIYQKFIQEEPYREIISQDAEAFRQQLPYYQIRILYTSLILLLLESGMDIIVATCLISALSVGIGLWCTALIFRQELSFFWLTVIPLASMAVGIAEIVRYSTPDALAFLCVCLIFLGLRRRHWATFLMLPVSILVRTDLLLLAIIVVGYIVVFIPKWRLPAIGTLSACVMLYLGANAYFENYGWATVMYATLIEALAYPANTPIHISFSDYMRIFWSELPDLLTGWTLLVYGIATGWTGYHLLKQPKKWWRAKRDGLREIFFFVVASWLYVLGHFVLFPASRLRFFATFYLLGFIGLFVLVSQTFTHPVDDKNSPYTHEFL